ncbi:MAG: FapA family protein [Sulfurospirillum sp.]
MGLFSKSSDNTDSKQSNHINDDFTSVIIDTQNIADEIKSVASSHNLDPKELSFRVLKVTTTYKTHKGEEFKDLSEKDKGIFNDNDFLLNPDLKIRQHYKVEIFKKSDMNQDEAIPEIMLSGNKSLTKIIATIKKNLDIKYFSKLEQRIIEGINTKKVQSNILVGIRDENMYKEVKKVVSGIRVKNFLEKDHMFIVCQGLDKVSAIDDKLIYHYKNKIKTKDRQGRVDYSKRGFILAVSKGETVIEYIKPQSGIPGKNCQGRFLSVKEPSSSNQTDINHTENIIKKEDDSKILYIANKNGYVNFENGTYDIQDNMEIASVDFKSTGSIETDLSADVKINIKESDIFKDAIGPGMSVETSELHVEGNIASGASIKAKTVEIKGQTHKTATIEADNVKIAVHRGNASGKSIEIDRLEGGFVSGENINIKSVIGGEIVGKNIYIEELTSNASIRAANLIDIKKLKGNNNKLAIDPTAIKQYSQKIENIKSEINKLTISIKPVPKILEAKKRVIETNKSVIEDIKNKIIELKNDGKTPPVSLLGKIKEYQKMVNDYNQILRDFKVKKQKISNLDTELQSSQDQIFSAKIINHGVWKEFNEVKFKLIYPPVEITYNTRENEIIREITLQRIENEKFEIKRSSEYS